MKAQSLRQSLLNILSYLSATGKLSKPPNIGAADSTSVLRNILKHLKRCSAKRLRHKIFDDCGVTWKKHFNFTPHVKGHYYIKWIKCIALQSAGKNYLYCLNLYFALIRIVSVYVCSLYENFAPAFKLTFVGVSLLNLRKYEIIIFFIIYFYFRATVFRNSVSEEWLYV